MVNVAPGGGGGAPAKNWYVVAKVGESQGSFFNPHIPADAKITAVDVGSPADWAWSGNGSYQGWQVVMGPFHSLSMAQKAQPPRGWAVIKQLIKGAGGVAIGDTTGGNFGSGAGQNFTGGSGKNSGGKNTGSKNTGSKNPPGTSTTDPNAGTGAAASGSDWQHLLVRFAEFTVGAILIAVAVNKLLGGKPVTIVETGAKTAGGIGAMIAAPEIAGPAVAARGVSKTATANKALKVRHKATGSRGAPGAFRQGYPK